MREASMREGSMREGSMTATVTFGVTDPSCRDCAPPCALQRTDAAWPQRLLWKSIDNPIRSQPCGQKQMPHRKARTGRTSD